MHALITPGLKPSENRVLLYIVTISTTTQLGSPWIRKDFRIGLCDLTLCSLPQCSRIKWNNIVQGNTRALCQQWQILRYKCVGSQSSGKRGIPAVQKGLKRNTWMAFVSLVRLFLLFFLSLNDDNSFSTTGSSWGFPCCALLYRTDASKQRIFSEMQWKWVVEQRWQCLHLSLFFTLLLWRFQACFLQTGLERVHPVLHGNADIWNVKVRGWAELSQLHIL